MDVESRLPPRQPEWHPPPSYIPPPAALAQRRRSSAAHHRPAAPPPTSTLPSIPDAARSDNTYIQSEKPSYSAPSTSYARQPPSPSLAAVLASSQSRVAHAYDQPIMLNTNVPPDDLSDSPPPSFLPTSRGVPAARTETAPILMQNDPSPPSQRQSEGRAPSSRSTLTRALELAREAVQLDSDDKPEAAVMAYGRSVALLSEVMERVRRGEDTTEPRRRNGRRRSIVAQEEEIRRLQNIHDTYADRMNILSIVFSIPLIPYTSDSVSSGAAPSDTPVPPSVGSEDGTRPTDAPLDVLEQHTIDKYTSDHLGTAMFPDEPTREPVAGLSSSSLHPYVSAAQFDNHPSQPLVPPNRVSVQRRPRGVSTVLPPTLPPPANSLPPAPGSRPFDSHNFNQHASVPQDLAPRKRTDSGNERIASGSRLVPVREEGRRAEEMDIHQIDHLAVRQPLSDSSGGHQYETQLPVPSPTRAARAASSPPTPRTALPIPRTPPSPRLSNQVTPRPRGSSQLSTRSDAPQMMINASTALGTISQRRSKASAPPTPRSSSPDSVASAASNPAQRSLPSSLLGNTGVSASLLGRSRSSSQPGRRPPFTGGGGSPLEPPPLPGSAGIITTQRKTSFPATLQPTLPYHSTTQTEMPGSTLPELIPPPPAISNEVATTPLSPLPPNPPSDPLLKPYHLMNLLQTTMSSPTGGYITPRLHIPSDVWSQGGAKLSNIAEKFRVVNFLCSALEELQIASAEYFGAGNVCSGLALGIGSIGRNEGEAWIAKLEDFSSLCDSVVAEYGKKLAVGEGFVVKKTTWGDKLGRRFDKLTNGKSLDSPAAYVQGLKKLFLYTQLLDEHTRAITSLPVAPVYAAFPQDIRLSVEAKLRRCSEFFARVVLTFVIRDLSQLLDKYAKKCEKWLADFTGRCTIKHATPVEATIKRLLLFGSTHLGS